MWLVVLWGHLLPDKKHYPKKSLLNRSSGKCALQMTADLHRRAEGRQGGSPAHPWCIGSLHLNVCVTFKLTKWVLFPTGGHSLPLNKLFCLTFKGSYGSVQFSIQASFLAVLIRFCLWVFVWFLLIENEHMADFFFKVRFCTVRFCYIQSCEVFFLLK